MTLLTLPYAAARASMDHPAADSVTAAASAPEVPGGPDSLLPDGGGRK